MTKSLDRIHRVQQRVRHDKDDLYAVLDAKHNVGTLSTVVDGLPWAVPLFYARDGDRLLFHGSTGAGALRHVAEGAPAAFSVTHMDGWVFGHSMFNHSAYYRSAVVRGSLVSVHGDEATEIVDRIADLLMPGRREEVRAHSQKELAATQALILDIVDGGWTVKIRDDAPPKPDASEKAPANLWTGMVPVRAGFGEPVTFAHHPDNMPVSPSVVRFTETVTHRYLVNGGTLHLEE